MEPVTFGQTMLIILGILLTVIIMRSFGYLIIFAGVVAFIGYSTGLGIAATLCSFAAIAFVVLCVQSSKENQVSDEEFDKIYKELKKGWTTESTGQPGKPKK